MRKYILVMASEFPLFTAQVNESIESGYEPLGAPFFKGEVIVQALVLKMKQEAPVAKEKKVSA